MPPTGVARRLLAALLTGGLATGVAVIGATTADAAVVRPFTLNYDKEVYGDFLESGNGNVRCPSTGDPVDPFGEPIANCAISQAGNPPNANSGNDVYYMRWSDVDSSAATYNSTTARVTIPSGARVDFARLNWSGDTGTIRLANGTVSAIPGCSTRQFLAGAGSANLPAGTPESTSVRLQVGGGAVSAVAPQVISRDALANVPASQPQFYAAHADVTANFANALTGVPINIGLGNVWSPEGFGCYAGWSIVVVYAYDAPNANAPLKRAVFVYDGHVRQSSADPATTTTVSGFRVAGAGARVGMTAYEGDRNIVGDTFAINGTQVPEPLPGGVATNFFVSNAQNPVNPAVTNNMSVDAKEFLATQIPVGATSATLTFATSGESYLAQNLVLSVPVPSLKITKTIVGGQTYRPGDPVTFQISVVSPGGSNAVNVTIDDPAFADCTRPIGNLAADVPVTYTCTGPAPADDFTNTATANGQNVFGDPMTDSSSASAVVINPGVSITKIADQPTYQVGQTITFTITVANTGDIALTNVVVADPKVAGCATTRPTLAIGGSFTYTCTTTAPVAGDSNTATVTGTDPLGGTVTATDTAPAPTVSTVSGRVFNDRDDDGVLDPANGEAGIGGVTVTLTGTDANGNPVAQTTTTAADGTYSFANVVAGTYTVRETQPAAYDDGIDTPGGAAIPAGNDAFTIILIPGLSSSDNNFAEIGTSSLAGSVYVDANNDGARDGGETGIGGTTVTLTGTDAGGNPVTLTTTTAADGGYSFPALAPGTYTVTEIQPAGYSDGIDTVGSAGGTVGDDTFTAITLPARTAGTGYLFGEFVAASVAGSVVDDAGNPIPGVTVTLRDANGNVVGIPVATGPDGGYSFTGLAPGTYSITETQPPGYGDGPDTPGSAGGDTTVNDTISTIVLGSGTAATGYVFAEDRGSLSGAVYVDADNNGAQDAGEAPIPGATVTLTGTDANGNPVTRTTTSGPDGSYTFADLVGGTYTVTETQPANYTDGIDTTGTAGGTNSANDVISGIELAGGVDATGYLFGESVPSSISGRVVDDAGNPIAGVTVTLLDANGAPVGDPVLTDANGEYTFTGLAPGTYSVRETQPAGYGDGPDTPGSAGGDNSVNDLISGIVLTSGTVATGYLFGETRTSLSGVVYEDRDDNGRRDAGEPGIERALVTLTGTDVNGNAVDVTVKTDESGAYTFTGVVGGTYSVTEAQPTGYADGQDSPGDAGGDDSVNDVISGIELDGTAPATGYLFGELPGVITGTVWVDPNGNGTIDPDEATRLDGVTVLLLDSEGNEIARTTTAIDGTYTFTGVRAGQYTVREQQPAGYGSTTPNDVVLTVPAGGSGTADFGERRGAIGDFVWSDDNRNGVQDAGEVGVAGVTVTLLDAEGAQVATTTTDENGFYRFVDIPVGSYRVRFDAPEGKAFTASGKPGDAVNSDPDRATGRTGEIVIAFTGDTITQRTEVDAGLVDRITDLGTAVSVDKPNAMVGDRVVFNGTVTNEGTFPVAGARTVITIPPGLTIGSVGGDGWTCVTSGQTVTCTTEAVLQPGAVAPPITVTTTATTPMSSTNATITVTLRDGSPDGNSSNDAAAVPVTVVAVPVNPPAPPEPPEPVLPSTGSSVLPLLLVGLLAVATGTGALVLSRRRRAGANSAE